MLRWLSLALIASPVTANADPPPTGHVAVAATVWHGGSAWDAMAYASPGVQLAVGYHVAPWLSFVGALDVVFVDPRQRNVGDVQYYSIGAGPRIHLLNRTRVEPYAGVEAGWHRFTFQNAARVALGVRLEVGVRYEVVPDLDVSLALGVNLARFCAEGGSCDAFAVPISQLGFGTHW